MEKGDKFFDCCLYEVYGNIWGIGDYPLWVAAFFIQFFKKGLVEI